MGGIHDYQIELVLIEYDIPATCWLKERSIKVTICQQHCQSCCKYRQTSNQLNTNKTNRPYKQRYTVQSHTLCTHVCYCYQEVNTTLNRPNTRHMETKNSLVYRCSRMALCTTKWGICSPSHTRSLLNQSTYYLQSLSHGLNPKANVVHSRKCHVGSSDHYRHQPVLFTADQHKVDFVFISNSVNTIYKKNNICKKKLEICHVKSLRVQHIVLPCRLSITSIACYNITRYRNIF